MSTSVVAPPAAAAADRLGRTTVPAPRAGHALELVADPAAVREGRRWATGAARTLGAGPELLELVELLVSELLTNGLRHGSLPGETLRVQVERSGRDLHVSVHDGATLAPVLRAAGPEDEQGRGMTLVDALAAAWGTWLHPAGGKCVWFTVPLAAG